MSSPGVNGPLTPASHALGQTTAPGRSTYREILKSTLLIGGSTGLSIAIGIVRTKVMAVLLGPAGFALMGIFASIADLARSVATMGINSSGVRQIAEAAGSGDSQRIARTTTVLRKTAVLLGIIGALLLVLLATPISVFTFGSSARADAVALLSLAVFLRLVADGQGALIQGMRRIADLAKMSVWGAVLGTLISIVIVYYMREDGVVPALIAVAGASLLTSWWYSRKVQIEPCTITITQVRLEATALLKLGAAFMVSGILMMGAAYAVRLIVLRHAGLDAAGLYQAAWTLGGLYVGFVLQALGADFYPRLVGAINDRAETNRLVNEQAEVSMLLAVPGVLATLTFAPLVIHIFYSGEFIAAVDVLRWICLGMAMRVITWPMGNIIVAMNRRVAFVGTELAWTVVNVGLSWLCVMKFGLAGAGMAFFGSYVFHGVMIYPIVRRLTGFQWSRQNLKTGLVFLASTGAAFCGFYLLPTYWALGFAMLVLLVGSVRSIWVLVSLVPPDQLPARWRRLVTRIRPIHNRNQ